ncbi:hypothetical protein SAV14893_020910 [Streptomyces avermitilis]|uniref:Uncharacterized protein n=1 Tax=Streptomyces avermitilis TaxID=33903 RepID=A0A4D4LWE5_STRAX|nr:hypothetical protein SAV14893_020910 [Streptomyces avermitilis]
MATVPETAKHSAGDTWPTSRPTPAAPPAFPAFTAVLTQAPARVRWPGGAASSAIR